MTTDIHPPSTLSLENFHYIQRLVRLYLPAYFDHEDIAVGIAIESWLNDHPRPSKQFIRQRCLNCARTHKQELDAMEDLALHTIPHSPHDEPTERLSDRYQVDQLVKVLSPHEKRVIAYRFFLDLTVEATAHELKWTAERVVRVTAEALHKMREVVQ